MSFTINTNITSMQAQQALRMTGEFQSKTINRVTTGLRIVSSGDDAAGLAIANTFRSDRAVLSQGIRNANDGLSNLQTIDGGLNNISQLLDRARTLAAQSASGSFNGNRAILNSEFQSVIAEIDRQAQAIGLDNGGAFAKSLSVFIGGGRSNAGTSAINNGSVSVNLTNSTVDARSLGLKGTQATGVSSIDIGSGSASTSVSAIVGNATNVASLSNAGHTDFYFRGTGFSDDDRVKVAVNLTGVTDTRTLVTALNSAIEAAGLGSTASAAAFKNAGIRAVVNTASDGTQQLAFTSSTTAFQVSAGDRMANALLGNVTSSSDPTGKTLANTVTGGSATSAGGAAVAAGMKVRFQGASLGSPVEITLSSTTVSTALMELTSAVANHAALQAAGINVTTATAGSALVFTSNRGERFEVQAAGDVDNALGLGAYRLGASNAFDYTSRTGFGGTFAAGSQTVQISVGGGAAQSIALTLAGADAAARRAAAIASLNQAFTENATLAAAGLQATDSGGEIQIASSNGTYFRLNVFNNAANILGFGSGGVTAGPVNSPSALTTAATFNSGGAHQTGVLAFSAIHYGNDDQTITLSANDADGAAHSLAVVLRNDATGRNARTVDEAINAINTALQQSNNATLKKIVAVKEQSGGAEGIRFLGMGAFRVGIGTTGAGNAGITTSQGSVLASSASAGGNTSDISTEAGGQSAVSSLANAVAALGAAQAVVGRAQNQFNFAVSLAQTQLNNIAAAESRIRDADLAVEAANLTKAQILQQAGIAALAQANVAPQAVLSLLRA